MHRNKKFVEKNIIPSRMSPLYAFHDVQTLPCNAELNFIINPDHLQSSNLTIADTITQDDVHNLRTYLQSWHYNAGQLEIKIQDKLEVKGQNQEGIAKGRPYVSQWLLFPRCIWK